MIHRVVIFSRPLSISLAITNKAKNTHQVLSHVYKVEDWLWKQENIAKYIVQGTL